jgi:hypothetical protein
VERRRKEPQPAHEGPLHVPVPFDDAIRRVLKVKPPPEGWKEYERKRRTASARPAGRTKRKGPRRAH